MEDFRAGHLGSSPFLPTELELSFKYEISRGTVRQILGYMEARGEISKTKSGRRFVTTLISEGVADAISAREGFEKHRLQKQRTVYAWGHNPRDASVREFMAGLLHGLEVHEIPLHLEGAPFARSHNSTELERNFIAYAQQQEDCSALVLWSDFRSKPISAIEDFKKTGRPVIFVENAPPSGFSCDHIALAHEQSAYNLVKFAVNLGHTNIVGLSNGQDYSSVRNRERGFSRAIADLGVQEFSRIVTPGVPQVGRPIGAWTVDEDPDSYDWVREQMSVAKDLIEQAVFGRKASLIIDLYDLSSTFVLQTLNDLKIEIPRNLSLLSFARKHTTTCSNALQPTGVLLDYYQLGKKASKLVSERVLGGLLPDYSTREIVSLLPTIREGGTIARFGAYPS